MSVWSQGRVTLGQPALGRASPEDSTLTLPSPCGASPLTSRGVSGSVATAAAVPAPGGPQRIRLKLKDGARSTVRAAPAGHAEPEPAGTLRAADTEGQAAGWPACGLRTFVSPKVVAVRELRGNKARDSGGPL